VAQPTARSHANGLTLASEDAFITDRMLGFASRGLTADADSPQGPCARTIAIDPELVRAGMTELLPSDTVDDLREAGAPTARHGGPSVDRDASITARHHVTRGARMPRAR